MAYYFVASMEVEGKVIRVLGGQSHALGVQRFTRYRVYAIEE